MKTKRFLSALLSVLMIFTMLMSAFMLQASAEDSAAGGAEGEEEEEIKEPWEIATQDALVTSYTSAQDKLNRDPNMKKYVQGYGKELYVNPYTGEVGYRDSATEQVLLTNPYNAPASHGSNDTKARLLSQLHIRFTDNDTDKSMYSYTEAAARGQIDVKHIKNGVRVEYTMGREENRYLVPGMMEKTRFETLILETIATNAEGGTKAWAYTKIVAFYMLKDPNAQGLSERSIQEMYSEYPITRKMAVYVLSLDTSDREKRELEGYIKTYCPEYGYDDLQYDHDLTGYVVQGKDPPLFKLSLEYTLDEDGLRIRLPANGLRFDESNYKLQYVQPLQFFGAGDMNNDGYIFYPDGSGAITYFDDMYDPTNKTGTNGTITGKIYGADYAYHEITGQHQEVIRMPVYGVIDSGSGTRTVTTIDELTGLPVTSSVSYTQYKGYMAILEDGDALANITAAFGGSQHMFASVYPTYYPRPSDEYNLADSLSVGENSVWTVESDRKYTGNYTLRVVMLADPYMIESKVASGDLKPEAADNYYDASWLGMAVSYRDYLVKQGMLTKLTSEDVEDALPLYIETFGSIIDTRKVLSVPVEVDVPLTTFDDIQTMYGELSDEAIGITNINFKLTGYTNGGMYSTYPSKVKWMKAVGGKSGYNELLEFAEATGAGIFPEFDFMYVNTTGMFDGVGLKADVVRTIDNRYSSKRVYDAVFQEFISYFNYCVSPLSLDELTDKFMKKFGKFEKANSISVSTLGSDLNSDFDEDKLSNREDSKIFITEVLEKLSADYSLLGSGGNAYTLKYFDHLLDVALGSSNFSYSSTAVPFVGATLHGYINFAGTPINMAGDIDLEFLKAIENGASLYFILSYQNTNLLKEDLILNKYYSVNYDIWKDELVERYKALNEAIGDLQTALITDHQFILGERIPNASEIERDLLEVETLKAEFIKAEVDRRYDEAVAKLKEDMQNGLIDPGSVPLPDKAVIETEVIADIESGKLTINLPSTTTKSEATAGSSYLKTKYTLDNNKLIYMTYTKDDGTEVNFVLNYNIYEAKVILNGTQYTIGAYGYLRVPEGGGN